MLDQDSDPESAYNGLLTHFIGENETGVESAIDLEKEFKQVQKSMENASKDYEIMMKIHQELKDNFQKLVQKKT